VGIQVFAVGFGTSQNVDEVALRHLAWPSPTNYRRAKGASDLVRAFQAARALQVERVLITLLANEHVRNELLGSRHFRVLWTTPAEVVEGELTWRPLAGLSVPPFEGLLPADLRPPMQSGQRYWIVSYLAVLLLYAVVFRLLWRHLPERLWARELDAEVLRRRVQDAMAQSMSPVAADDVLSP
jgi:hypothetical protein